MPEAIRCDVCGKMYNSRHISSHKRLAHASERPDKASQQALAESIRHLFAGLSSADKERVLAELAAMGDREPY